MRRFSLFLFALWCASNAQLIAKPFQNESDIGSVLTRASKAKYLESDDFSMQNATAQSLYFNNKTNIHPVIKCLDSFMRSGYKELAQLAVTIYDSYQTNPKLIEDLFGRQWGGTANAHEQRVYDAVGRVSHFQREIARKPEARKVCKTLIGLNNDGDGRPYWASYYFRFMMGEKNPAMEEEIGRIKHYFADEFTPHLSWSSILFPDSPTTVISPKNPSQSLPILPAKPLLAESELQRKDRFKEAFKGFTETKTQERPDGEYLATWWNSLCEVRGSDLEIALNYAAFVPEGSQINVESMRSIERVINRIRVLKLSPSIANGDCGLWQLELTREEAQKLWKANTQLFRKIGDLSVAFDYERAAQNVGIYGESVETETMTVLGAIKKRNVFVWQKGENDKLWLINAALLSVHFNPTFTNTHVLISEGIGGHYDMLSENANEFAQRLHGLYVKYSHGQIDPIMLANPAIRTALMN